MSKASMLLEQYARITKKRITEQEEMEMNPKTPESEISVSEEDDIKTAGDVIEDLNSLPVATSAIAKIVEPGFSGNNELQLAAVEEMKKLAESDELIANKFMEALDDVTSAMVLKEDADAEAMYVFEPEKWKALGEKYSKNKK